uniref:Uncharacterized protein n=1 Tax=Candidatus Kentrum sp. LFY TaxID=2126342 RepID=A0A450V7S4_9GAMM|nr:MAG: hypothetical protein BECKLFY1418B_GA0070995_12121 [Candidatus Kentron sp. LFY]
MNTLALRARTEAGGLDTRTDSLRIFVFRYLETETMPLQTTRFRCHGKIPNFPHLIGQCQYQALSKDT